MPYQNKWEEVGLHRTFTGTISGQEVLTANLSIQGDPRFDDINFVLNDFTAIDGFDVTEIDISKIVATDNAAAISNPNLKIAIVATDKSLLEWIYMYLGKMETSPYQCQIFHNKNDALTWVYKSALEKSF